jgi:hypothetical protein
MDAEVLLKYRPRPFLLYPPHLRFVNQPAECHSRYISLYSVIKQTNVPVGFEYQDYGPLPRPQVP